MKNVAFHNLGCKVNSYEMDFMQQILQKKGYIIVPFDEYADIYVINTCTVTNIADRKSRQMIHRAKTMNPNAIVVAVGCYVQTDTQGAMQDPNVDILIGNNQKSQIAQILSDYISGKDTSKNHVIDVNDVKNPCQYEEMSIETTAEHTRAYIKVQDGCNQFCSYCMIPFARGRVRSREMTDVLEEVHALVKNGYQEIVVTGIHISSYGTDFKDSNIGILDLLKQIHEIEGVERIRLGSLEPRIITEKFVQELAGMKKICPHFHLSLQSGCNSVLKRMNRHYSTEEYKAGVELLRTAYENPAITTDIIVGFPGETKEEFEATKAYMEEIGFYEVHLFPYSRRKGTVADKMPGQLTRREKADRLSILSEIEKRQSRAFRESFLGKKVKVLFEEEKEIKGKTYLVGHTTCYVQVAALAEIELKGQIREVTLREMLTDEIALGIFIE